MLIRLYSKPYNYNELSDHDLYIVFRTKFIITGKVIKQLDFLASVDFGYDTTIIGKVRALYADFHQNAIEQIAELQAKSPQFISDLNEKLLNK